MRQSPGSLRQLDLEESCPIVWTAVGEFSAAAQADGGMKRIRAQSRKGELADGREVAGGVAFSDATVVFT